MESESIQSNRGGKWKGKAKVATTAQRVYVIGPDRTAVESCPGLILAARSREEPWNLRCTLEESQWNRKLYVSKTSASTVFFVGELSFCRVALWAVIKWLHFSADCCFFPMSDSPTPPLVYIFLQIVLALSDVLSFVSSTRRKLQQVISFYFSPSSSVKWLMWFL